MFERFTDRARKVMALANQEAQRFNHEYIGTEHILLGVVKEGGGVGANVLKNLEVDLRKVRLEVEKLVKSGPDMVTMGKLPQTPRAKKVIEYAIEEARSLNHNYVGTEHLLLGLLREQDGIAAQVLTNLGLKVEDVRDEVLNLLGAGLEPLPPIEEPQVVGKNRKSVTKFAGRTRMMNKKIVEAFNEQMNWELYSAYLYLSMAAYFDAANLPGFANWMKVQVQEELAHVMKFYTRINDRGGRVELTAVKGPPTDWQSPIAAFEDTLKHEQGVSGLINKLVKLVRDELDTAAEIFLQWFVTEQVEEEASASRVLEDVKLAAGAPGAMVMLDRELAQRVVAPQTPAE